MEIASFAPQAGASYLVKANVDPAGSVRFTPDPETLPVDVVADLPRSSTIWYPDGHIKLYVHKAAPMVIRQFYGTADGKNVIIELAPPVE